MKFLIKLLIAFIINNFAFAEVSYDHILSTSGKYNLKQVKEEIKIENTLLNEEAILNEFTPKSVTLLSKKISGNEFELIVEKKILGFNKRFKILGDVTIERSLNNCGANEESYYAYFDFSRSGNDVTDAVAALGLRLCVNKSVPVATIVTSNNLFYRGKKYGFITEPIAKSVLNEQVAALFEAIQNNVLK